MNTQAFWAFSLEFYGRDGVASACMTLQDACGADVDVVLFALWCASRGTRLRVSNLDSICATVASWHLRVVQSIRQARGGLKPAPPAPFCALAAEALRQSLLAAELEAERLQHCAMEALAPPPGVDDPVEAAVDNLACFARHAGIPPDAAPFAALLKVFP